MAAKSTLAVWLCCHGDQLPRGSGGERLLGPAVMMSTLGSKLGLRNHRRTQPKWLVETRSDGFCPGLKVWRTQQEEGGGRTVLVFWLVLLLKVLESQADMGCCPSSLVSALTVLRDQSSSCSLPPAAPLSAPALWLHAQLLLEEQHTRSCCCWRSNTHVAAAAGGAAHT